MRLWHYKLIPYLPQKQLVAQWRECCCIAKNIADNGTPNHLLVNKILEYAPIHFIQYTNLILAEMNERGYKVSETSFLNFCNNMRASALCFNDKWDSNIIKDNKIFPYWHRDRYLKQCLYNLQEKFDCNGITYKEWIKIHNRFVDIL